MTLRFVCVVLLALAAALGTGCTSALQPYDTERAHPGIESPARDSLTALPPPKDQLVAAVYRFRDQTGQYKQKERGSTFSTAVTQGATSILISALKDSDWFVPIERKGLSNLLNERDIIRSIRAQHGDGNSQLSPLLYAGVMLEGGIIGYDTNVITGGGGLRILGVGGSGEFRRDQVTVYLRAVSTKSGRVLASVNTTKSILSQKLDGDAFRYVDTDAILETEIGVTYNEPTLFAVTEAIDAAVRDLVVQGAKEGAWSFRNQSAALRTIERYEAAQRRAERRDAFDRLLQPDNRSGFAIEVAGGGMRYQGDYESPQAEPSASLALRQPLGNRWTVGLEGSYGRLSAAGGRIDRETITTEARLTYYLTPQASFSPFLRAAGGVQAQFPFNYRFGDNAFPVAGGSVGFEIMPASRLGISAAFGTRYSFDDELDGASVGRYDDSIWRVDVGITYYTDWL
jgi:curli production assembly/transport component CsgG